MDDPGQGRRGGSVQLIAVALASVVSAAASRGLSDRPGLVVSTAIGATVGAAARWSLYRVRLRDDLDRHGQNQ
ncbi:hypothetical protein [Streptomyces rubellomurinus]|uniref:Transmembrane protein n=1 Tax=Streptomyces rubellomurinus (strain ATCC 31215) TaxID=359131 RepID=A0A0F2TC19_STRR3|nr:hypothetical protein [Streptomyces rubellomurinus]KJS60709.1 hypothetical protein VM95_19305 [Streptomyces rubellomurinus]